MMGKVFAHRIEEPHVLIGPLTKARLMPLGKVMLLAVSLTIKSAEVLFVVGVFRTRLDVPSCRVSRLSLGYSFLASILVPEIPAADHGTYLANLWAYCGLMKKKYYGT